MKWKVQSVGIVEISLRPRWRAVLFLLGVSLGSAFLAGQILRVVIAAALERSPHLARLRWALALDPSNPSVHRRLGLLYCYSPATLDPAEGVPFLRRAAELASVSASSWVELGLACESVGEVLCAQESFSRALSLSPMTPRIWWHAANYNLRAGRTEEALAHFRRLLQLSPAYAASVFRLCHRVVNDGRLLYARLLAEAKDARVSLAYADFLAARGDTKVASYVWDVTVSGSRAFPFTWAEPYVERLISQYRVREAAKAWQELMRLGILPAPPTDDPTNLIFNGDFEQSPLNAGFDWRLSATPYVSLDLADPRAYQGKRSVRLEFTVARNEDCEPLYQIVVVEPQHRYRLMAFVRSENIASDSGPRLRVRDLSSGQRLEVTTAGTVGTTGWHPVSTEFSTGPESESVRLSVWRPRSRLFPGEVSGAFWLDAVHLQRLGRVAEGSGVPGATPSAGASHGLN